MFIVLKRRDVLLALVILLSLAAVYLLWRMPESEAKDRAIFFAENCGHRLAFTFDVAYSDNYVHELLQVLEENGLRTTFFLTGRWIEDYPDLARAMLAGGHEIGSHAYNHVHFKELAREEILEQFNRFEDAARETLDYKPRYFRPPYGEFNGLLLELAARRGYRTVIWTIDSRDWMNEDHQRIVDRVLARLHPGAIVLFRTGSQSTVEALPLLIRQIEEHNYQIVTLSELLAAARTGEG